MTTTDIIPITLDVAVRGEVITSNAAEFRDMVREFLATINRAPETDEEFGLAEQNVKGLKTAEDTIRNAKEKALSDAKQLQALFDTLDETSEEIRQARLDLEKTIKAKKEEVRTAMVERALDAIDLDVSPGRKRALYFEGLSAALKGKRSLSSMEESLRIFVTTTNGKLAKSRDLVEQFERQHGAGMVIDREALICKSADAVEAELGRLLDQRAAMEREAKARAEAEVLRKQQAEKAEQSNAAPGPQNPVPPKATPAPLPQPDPGDDPNEVSREWRGFQQEVIQAFAPVKQARAALMFGVNRQKAERFAQALAAAWKEVTQ